MADKKYYWLKLQKDFFHSKRIKKLRSLAGGDTYTIIYLKMQLLSLDLGGILEYTGLEDSFAKELALDIDESPDNVAVTVNYLLSCGLLEENSNYEYFLPYVAQNTQSESSYAQKQRDYRAKKTLKIQCPTEIEKEIDIEIDTDKEKESDKEKDIYTVRFDKFWSAYPKKTGKGAALNSWKKIKPDKELFDKIMASLEEHKGCEQWSRQNGQFIPNPATWLNQMRWEDEVEVAHSSNIFFDIANEVGDER